MMLIDVPIHYKAKGRMEVDGVASTRTFHEFVQIDIPVVDEDVAPIVAKWQAKNFCIRKYKDSYFAPVSKQQYQHLEIENKEIVGIASEEFATAIATNSQDSPFRNFYWTGRSTKSDDVVFHKVLHSQRIVEMRAAARIAEKYIILNDMLHEKCSEPHYRVTQNTIKSDTKNPSHIVDVIRDKGYVVSVSIYNGRIGENVFQASLDDFDLALSKCRKLNAKLKDSSKTKFIEMSEYFRATYYDDLFRDETTKAAFYSKSSLIKFLERYDLRDRHGFSITEHRLYCDLMEAMDEPDPELMMRTIEMKGRSMIDYVNENIGPLESQNISHLRKAVKIAECRPVIIPYIPNNYT